MGPVVAGSVAEDSPIREVLGRVASGPDTPAGTGQHRQMVRVQLAAEASHPTASPACRPPRPRHRLRPWAQTRPAPPAKSDQSTSRWPPQHSASQTAIITAIPRPPAERRTVIKDQLTLSGIELRRAGAENVLADLRDAEHVRRLIGSLGQEFAQ